MLKGLDAETIGHIYVLLEPVRFQAGEYAYRMRDKGGVLFFVTMGAVDLKGVRGFLGMW